MPIIIGLIFILAAVWTILPTQWFGLGWGPVVLGFLQGGAPILVIFIGLLAIFIGLADIKDKMQAKKESSQDKSKKE